MAKYSSGLCVQMSDQCVQELTTATSSSSLCLWPEAAHLQRLPLRLASSFPSPVCNRHCGSTLLWQSIPSVCTLSTFPGFSAHASVYLYFLYSLTNPVRIPDPHDVSHSTKESKDECIMALSHLLLSCPDQNNEKIPCLAHFFHGELKSSSKTFQVYCIGPSNPTSSQSMLTSLSDLASFQSLGTILKLLTSRSLASIS